MSDYGDYMMIVDDIAEAALSRFSGAGDTEGRRAGYLKARVEKALTYRDPDGIGEEDVRLASENYDELLSADYGFGPVHARAQEAMLTDIAAAIKSRLEDASND
jgi:hypothetical protein